MRSEPRFLLNDRLENESGLLALPGLSLSGRATNSAPNKEDVRRGMAPRTTMTARDPAAPEAEATTVNEARQASGGGWTKVQ
jgi:hypothetical protein